MSFSMATISIETGKMLVAKIIPAEQIFIILFEILD